MSGEQASSGKDAFATCPPSDGLEMERNRFFYGRLLDTDDLAQEQRYIREKVRRHNRLLHGWGIVCGLGVRPGDDPTQPCEVVVEAGYALGPHGDEIVVQRDVSVDLCTADGDGNVAGPCPPTGQSPHARVERPSGRPFYLAIAYAECPVGPVPVGDHVEYTRLRDAFVLRVLDQLPASSSAGEQPALGSPRSACSPCPAEPWVVLAALTRNDA